MQVYRQLLIILRHLLPQVPASRVNHQIKSPVRRTVHLDKMVASAQRAQASHHFPAVLNGAITPQGLEIKTGLPPFPNLPAGGDKMCRFIQPLHVNLPVLQADGIHAASNVYAHQIGDRLVCYGHGRTNGTALSPVGIRHDADTAPAGKFLIAKPADLFHGVCVNRLGIAHSCADLPFHFHHMAPPLFTPLPPVIEHFENSKHDQP